MTTTMLSMVGKSFACMAFAVVYVYGSEFFPTQLRNILLGTAKTSSRVSSVVASYVGGPLVSYAVLVHAVKEFRGRDVTGLELG